MSQVSPSPAPNPLLLTPEPGAARHARTWVSGVLAGWPDDGVETARLLVSELVTNSVLHAGTAIAVEYRADGPRARFGVRDRHQGGPVTKRYAPDSPTGRGMRLVASLAEDWGVERDAQGKTVWFAVSPSVGTVSGRAATPAPAGLEEDLGAAPSDAPLSNDARVTSDAGAAPAGTMPPAGGPGDGPGASLHDAAFVDVQVLALPLEVYLEAEQHNDAVVRELTLIVQSASTTGGLDVPRRLLELATEVRKAFAPASDGMRAQVDEAIRLGLETVDLHMTVPRQGWKALLRLADQLEEVDRYCVDGELLTLESSPRLRRFRVWYARQVAQQMQGLGPTPWEPTAPQSAKGMPVVQASEPSSRTR